MPPALLTRTLDPLLGLWTGVLAYYLYETHPRNTVPENERLAPLLRWKWEKMQQARAERLHATEG